jgi:hypothetical protein
MATEEKTFFFSSQICSAVNEIHFGAKNFFSSSSSLLLGKNKLDRFASLENYLLPRKTSNIFRGTTTLRITTLGVTLC